MRIQIQVTILLLACIWASTSSATESKKIEDLLTENTKELTDTKLILRHIDGTNDQIKASLEQQRVWLEAIKNVDALLTKLHLFNDAQSVVLVEALNNITHKTGHHADRVIRELGSLTRLQLSTKQQISGLETKLDAYQKHVLQNVRGIDNSILDLTKLITRAVLPQLNGLQCSFDSLETSQINIEVELKSLPRIKDLSEDSNLKLALLGTQLASLNRTQDARLSILSHAVSQLKPLNTWQIESALRELIISQKRIELDLDACDKRPSPHHPKPHSPAPYPAYEIESPAPSRPHHGKPSPQSHYHTSAYAPPPEPKPQPGKPSIPSYDQYAAAPTKPSSSSSAAHAVSWQQPLPWEAVAAYQSAPAPAPKAYQPGPGRRRPAQNPQPCTKGQHSQHPPRHSAPTAYGPPAPPAQSYSQQYQQQGPKHGQPIAQERQALWY